MVETIKPNLQRSVRLTYSQPELPENQAEDSSDWDAGKVDDLKRLIGGGAPMMIGSTGDGTIPPTNRLKCFAAIALAVESVSVQSDVAEGVLDHFLRADDPPITPTDNFQFHPALLIIGFLVGNLQSTAYRGNHILFWKQFAFGLFVPVAGPARAIQAAYKDCERPGSGLGKKLTEKIKSLKPTPALAPTPAPAKSLLAPAAISVGLATGVAAGARLYPEIQTALSNAAVALVEMGAATFASLLMLPINPELLQNPQPKPDQIY